MIWRRVVAELGIFTSDIDLSGEIIKSSGQDSTTSTTSKQH